jgi:ABC-type glycerol-3-phosphate transport system permease component
VRIFLPYIVGLVAESYMAVVELQPSSGTANFVLWFASGLTMMLLMAGMQGILIELYESARFDGASWWSAERRIKLPLLRRSVALSLIISVVGSFLAFNQFFIITDGGPGTSTVLTPLFLELHFLHLLNSLLGLALFYTTFNLPVGMYVMRNSFLQVPREIVDAARVDGASVTRTLLSVLRPLVLPGIATSALYAFLFSWTEFLGALSFMTNDSLLTLPVALSNVETGTYGAINYGLLLAGAVIAMIPCIVVYVALQRYYVRGLVSGALKG